MTNVERFAVTAERKALAGASATGTRYWYYPLSLVKREDLEDEVIFTLQEAGNYPFRISVASADTASVAAVLWATAPQPAGSMPPRPVAPLPPGAAGQRPPAPYGTPSGFRAAHTGSVVLRSHARATRVTNVVEALAWVFTAIVVIVGIKIASTVEDLGDEKVHPYVGVGLGVAIGGAFQFLIVAMAALHVKVKLELASLTVSGAA